ncbi:hypothetical protein [Hahella ganghwensis]|uniref:hypothetical protein n=1 Tax=Hahella ganghwensis TaxID=286420 RepID=UPI00035EACE6|nr:hypothetical protein [Hahella ganghwensis]
MDWLDDFYQLSAALTDYKVAQLQGTGVGEDYLEVLSTIIPHAILAELFGSYRSIVAENSATPTEQLIRDGILSNAKLGPVARNIIKMWYLSIWYQMPEDWRQLYGKPNQGDPKYQDVQFVVSRNAYIQGLVWQTLGSHPMGAKQPGYGTWGDKPSDRSSIVSTTS